MKTFSMARSRRILEEFLFRPVRTLPFAVLRIGVALSLLFETYSLGKAFFSFVGPDALVQRSVAREFESPFFPSLYSILDMLTGVLRVSENAALWLVIACYFAALAALLVGTHARVGAVAAWLLHMTLVNGAGHTTYGADQFHHIALFYLIVFPSGPSILQLAQNRQARSEVATGPWARVSLRILQLHLCVVYAMSGYEKLVSSQWHDGEIIWRAMTLPIYQQFELSSLVSLPAVAMLVAWGTIAAELSYPVLVWSRRTRVPAALLIFSMHVGIGIFLGLWVFAAVMSVLTLAAFLTPSEPPKFEVKRALATFELSRELFVSGS